MQQNFQFTVENEDLRDRMSLIGKGEAVVIDYLPYVPPMQLEKVIQAVNNREELDAAKNLILSHYFSLQKSNRSLAKRLKSHNTAHRSRRKPTADSPLIEEELSYAAAKNALSFQSSDSVRDAPSQQLSPKAPELVPVTQKQQEEARYRIRTHSKGKS